MNKRFSGLLVVTLLLVSLLSLGTTQSSAGAIPTEEDIRAILLDYSTCLSTGQVTKDSYYSPMMRDLLQDRRGFYKEFFDVGLHSDLLSIESDFTIESIVQDDEQGNLYNVKATEMVILHGKYRCSSPEEYPLVKSGRWALSRTDDPAVKKAIEGYIESMVDGVNESIKEGGFDIVFVVRHELVMSNEKSLRIVQDSFTDAANDNPEGTDNISWINGRFVRRKPDLTKMPDYVMYNTPIEQLGESLLDTYSRIFRESMVEGPHRWVTHHLDITIITHRPRPISTPGLRIQV
ncbi:MAG: hypothetical protein SVX38_13210 [Chloroflexota bacterium]|nr:hypothetical protein [Chloroflexota bacterium]